MCGWTPAGWGVGNGESRWRHSPVGAEGLEAQGTPSLLQIALPRNNQEILLIGPKLFSKISDFKNLIRYIK